MLPSGGGDDEARAGARDGPGALAVPRRQSAYVVQARLSTGVLGPAARSRRAPACALASGGAPRAAGPVRPRPRRRPRRRGRFCGTAVGLSRRKDPRVVHRAAARASAMDGDGRARQDHRPGHAHGRAARIRLASPDQYWSRPVASTAPPRARRSRPARRRRHLLPAIDLAVDQPSPPARLPAARLPPSCGPVRLIGGRRPRRLREDHLRRPRWPRRWAARPCCTWTTSPPTRSCSAGPGGCSRQVIEPLAPRRDRPVRPLRLDAPAASAPPRDAAPPRPSSWSEGVGAGRRAACGPWLARLLWMERAGAGVLGARAGSRDGAEQRTSGTAGSQAETRPLRRGPVAPVRGPAGTAVQEGYEVLPGPAGSALDRTRMSPTVTDRPQCAELVKSRAVELRRVPQLGLTRGRTGLTFSMCGFSKPPADAKPPVVPP